MNFYIFTDGSSIDNGKLTCKAKCGYAIFVDTYEKGLIKKGSKSLNKDLEIKHPELFNKNTGVLSSNQSAELAGIYFGLRSVIKLCDRMNVLYIDKIQIITDSKYSIQVYTEWLKLWEKNNFKTTKGTSVKHVEMIKETDKLIRYFKEQFKGLQVEFIHVNSHKRKPDKEKEQLKYFHWYGNNLVDNLASA